MKNSSFKAIDFTEATFYSLPSLSSVVLVLIHMIPAIGEVMQSRYVEVCDQPSVRALGLAI